MALWNSRGRSVATVASIVALTASGTMAVNAALAPDPINGCVSKLTGGVRIPGAGQTCNALENPLSWNNSGPAGPAGPAGPQGAQGEQGPAGPTGTTNSYLDNHPADVDLFSSRINAPIEVSGWDVPAGSYQLDARASLVAHPTNSSGRVEYVRCSIRASDQVLKVLDTLVGYPSTRKDLELVTVLKVDAPTRMRLVCYNDGILLGGDAKVSGIIFSVTGLGETRGI
jgi:hypothetical protein